MDLDLNRPRLAGRALALLYLAGAAILLLTIFLPSPHAGHRIALVAIFGIAFAAAILLFALADRIRTSQLQAGVALGSTLVALVVYFSAESTSPLAIFYVWVATYSSFFFSRRAFAMHMAWAAITYGAALAVLHQGQDSIPRWFATLSIASVTGALIAWLASELRTWAAETVRLREAENRQLDERVRERTSELAAANTELEAFCYSVAHDLRAPLRTIDGFTKVAMAKYSHRLGSHGESLLEHVRAESNRMAELIDELLMLSRLTRKQMQREPVDISAVAAEIVAALRERAPEREVAFDIEEHLTADGDAELIRTLLRNLLENAWKFTSLAPRPRIELAKVGTNGRSAYVVRDNGVGFDMRYRDKLFRPFERLHRQDEFPGHGVGLTTVQRIVQRHGGEIWAEAEPGQGAAFFFSLRALR